jgi:MFS family permease
VTGGAASPAKAPGDTSPRRDALALALVLLAFLAVNLATAPRYPYPWIDEVLAAEPAINLATGRGFTSAAWQTSASDAVFASPYPLYSLYLAGWVRIFGIGQLSVRSAPIFLVAAAIAVIWVTTRKLNLVTTTGWRVALAVMIACDYGFAFSYRGSRPDALSVLLLSLMFYSFSWRSAPRRYAVLFIGALLMPGLGLHIVAFCLLLGTALLLFWRGRRWREAALVCAGFALGGLCFYASYQALEIWPAFRRELEFQGGSNLPARVWQRLTTNPIRNHSITIPKDPSLLFLGFAMIATTIALARRRALTSDSLAFLGLLVAIVVSAGLYFGLRFSTYYSWMAFIPLAIIYCAIWSRSELVLPRKTLIALLSIACLTGLPLQLAIASHDWRDRDPAAVHGFVDAAVREDDVVYCDWTAYYPAKAKARRVYLPKYLLRITPEEASTVTVAIVSPYRTPRLDLDAAGQLATLGGEWIKTGESLQPSKAGLLGNNWESGYLSLPNYALQVWRRAPGRR